VVLYHCCMSLAVAKAIDRAGFDPGELVAVTDKAPDCHAVVFLGVPLGFRLEDFPLADTRDDRSARLIPGLVLNSFPRAVWPD
jgi:hypothetical protein